MSIIESPGLAVASPLRELSPAVSQQVFRACMDAFARPGSVHSLPLDELPAGASAALLPLLALADIMTPIGALTADTSAADVADATADTVRAIGRAVGARVVDAASARYGLALAESSAMRELSPGSHWSPEAAATLVQRVESIDAASVANWRLRGPGIPPVAPVALRITGIGDRFVAERGALVADYPAGIDCLLVTDDGALVALSRTTRIEMI